MEPPLRWRAAFDDMALPVTPELPIIGHALSLNSENRWSDLLAVLIATDPEPMCRVLNIGAPPSNIEVDREATIQSTNRPDIVLRAGTRRVAVIEVKVLSGLGPRQLERYHEAEPGAERYVVVFPERRVVDTARAAQWWPVPWEAILDAYAASVHPWVSTTAVAWRAHLAAALPEVNGSTRWSALADGEPFVIAMRARASWVFSHLNPPSPVEHDLVWSSAGASAVVRMLVPAAAENYQVLAEMEERMGVRSIPKFANATTHPLIGPSVKVALLQEGVTTSAGFDWDYLLAMWPLIAAARDDWVRQSANPKHPHDRANHQKMVAKGGPKYLGIGYGERQTRITGQCLFGARFQLPPDITLGHLVMTLEETAELLIEMARVPPPM